MYLDDQNIFCWSDTVHGASGSELVGGSVFGNVIDLLGGVTDLEYTGSVRTLRGLHTRRTIFANTTGAAANGTLTSFELELVTASNAALSADVTVLHTSTNFVTLLAGTTAAAILGLQGELLPSGVSYERYLGLRVAAAYAADNFYATGVAQIGLVDTIDGYKIPTAGGAAV